MKDLLFKNGLSHREVYTFLYNKILYYNILPTLHIFWSNALIIVHILFALYFIIVGNLQSTLFDAVI